MKVIGHNEPCVCGNVNKDGKPVKYKKCCGDKPEEDKLYYDREVPKWLMSQLQLIGPFFSSNPGLISQKTSMNTDKSIHYNFLKHDQLELLFSKKIPVYNPISPFSYDFAKLNRYLSKEIDKEKFFTIFMDILYNEFSINFGRINIEELYINRIDDLNKIRDKQLIQLKELIISEHGTTEGINTCFENQLGYPELYAKWYIDDLFFRIRSQWDKLIYLLINGYNNSHLNSKKLGNKNSGKIREIIDKTQNLNEEQLKFRDTFIEMLLTLDNLKSYRDPALHTISPKAKNVFGAKNSKTILELWEEIRNEHNKIREGLLTVIGIIVLE